MRKDLRFRLRSLSSGGAERSDKKNRRYFQDLLWCVMCRSLHKKSIILDAMKTSRVGR